MNEGHSKRQLSELLDGIKCIVYLCMGTMSCFALNMLIFFMYRFHMPKRLEKQVLKKAQCRQI